MSENTELLNGEELLPTEADTTAEVVETMALAVEIEETEVIEATETPEETAEETETAEENETAGEIEATEETETTEQAATEALSATVAREDEEEVDEEPLFDEGFLGTCERALYKSWKWIKKLLHIPDMSKKQRAIVWDKITTGILIALFATPFAVLLYILLWFILRNV